MKEKIIEFLEKTSPKWRSRLLVKNIEMKEYLDTIYPNHSTLEQIYMILNSLDTRPVCPVCGREIKFNGIEYKNTCSVKCKIAGAKLSGNFQKGREKAKITNLEKYGFESASQSEEVIQKRLDSMMEKYGSLVSPKSREAIISRLDNLQKKARETFLEKYGVSNPGQLSDHNEKVKNTILEKYGVDHIFKTPKWKEKIKERQLSKLGNNAPEGIEILNIFDPVLEKIEKYENPNKLIHFVCHQCNRKDSIPSETYKFRIHEYDTPCKTCAGIESHKSLKESDLFNYISSIGNFEILRNNRLAIAPYELDIYIPSKNLAIEFDGLYYHNDLRITKDYHSRKTKLCKEKNIKLIHIFEDEWDYQKEIVKKRLKYILGLEDSKIYARKTEIKEISTEKAKEFLKLNHIQGYANSTIKLGLFHNDMLVSVMTFGRLSKIKGYRESPENHWELIRFSSSGSVIGGASKLFQYFIENYNPEKIISYSDLRWNSGKLYEKLGFAYVKNTDPGYWYVKGNVRIHRSLLQKNNQDDQSLTEMQNRRNQGYLIIWDCGHSKWIWQK